SQARLPGFCEAEPTELQHEEHAIEGRPCDKEQIRYEEADVENPGRVSENTVRDELGHIERPRTTEDPSREDVAESSSDGANLAAVLVLGLRRRLLDGDRRGLVHRTEPSLFHEVREPEVVSELRIVLDVGIPFHCVDRTIAGGDGAARRLLLT